MNPVLDYSHDYDPDADFDRWFTKFTADRIRRWLRPPDRVLEMGAATGLMTAMIAPLVNSITSVERSPAYVDKLRSRGLSNVAVHQGDAENFSSDATFNHVVATSLFGNLSDQRRFLRNMRPLLSGGGLVHVTVNNPRSLHRLLAVEMGLIASFHDLSAANVRHGTRPFDREEVERIAASAGFQVVHREGILLKPLPNDAMARLTDQLIEALDRIAHHLDEYAAIQYFVLARANAEGPPERSSPMCDRR
ncbi:MAG: class I SAM-dependent methyltransferase [Alphaproteobacteria bacterium]|nr:class I SAM-dependent methyltransferase [Alphaproteobacteria bacterium]